MGSRSVDGTLGTCSSATACYVYDANGLRVRVTAGSAASEYLHDVNGNTVAQNVIGFGAGFENVYLGSQVLAKYADATTYFQHHDHLGSARLMTKLDQSTRDWWDYLPFGKLVIAGNSYEMHLFTGKEHDWETGLDYFGARHNSSNLGRFITPDGKLATERHLKSPQKWNKYAYVQNNPLARIDPDGLDDYVVFRVAADFKGGDAVVGTHAKQWKEVEKTITSQKDSKGNFNTFHMVEGSNATVENYNKALATPDTHVLFIGHASERSTTDTTATGIILSNGNSQGNQGSTTQSFSLSPEGDITQDRLTQNDPSPINASSVALFACGTDSLASQYDNTDFTGVQSGPGGTMTDTLDLAAAAFVLAGGGQAGADAANAVIENSPHALDTGSNVENQPKPEAPPPQN